jgi:DNA-binding SARP family transcriptional activator
VVRACELLVTAGELAEAETIALSGVEAEPMNERATRALANVLLARGRVGVARDVVETLFGTLTECGLEPEPETAGLAARLRVGRRSTA